MDYAHKAALSAAVVAIVLMAARLFGARIAGLLTGLPIVTAPALVWVVIEQGHFAAVSAAVGSVAACAVAALFALCYDRLARKARPSTCLAAATVLAGLVCLAARELFSDLFVASAVSISTCCLVLRSLSHASDMAPQPGLPSHANLLFTIAFAGLTSPLSTLGQVDPFLVGLLAGLPIVAATVVVTEHACAGSVAVTCFLRGYVVGLIGKAAFGVLFALLLLPFGLHCALLVASAASALICAVGTSQSTRGHILAGQTPTRPIAVLTPDPGASHQQQ